MVYFIVFLGGGAGAVSRFFLSKSLNPASLVSLPIGTIVANLVGCFLMGLSAFYFSNNTQANLKLLIMTGFLGALTTFSSFSYESVLLYRDSGLRLAGINFIINNLGGIASFVLGLWLGQKFISS